MSTHLGHVMPKQIMSKTMEKMCQKYNITIDPNLQKVRFKVCIEDLTNSDVPIRKVSRPSQQNS